MPSLTLNSRYNVQNNSVLTQIADFAIHTFKQTYGFKYKFHLGSSMVRQNSVVLVQDLNYKNINLNSIYNDFISYLYLIYLKKSCNYEFDNKFYEKENGKLQQVGGGKILKKIFKILKKNRKENLLKFNYKK